MNQQLEAELKEWQINKYVGDNAKYFKKKWFTHTGTFYGGWNWVSLFFGVEWLVYRKMYKEAVITFCIPLLLWLAFLISPLRLDINGKLLGDSVKILVAIFGNGLYRRKLISILEKNKGLKQSQMEEILHKAGGTNTVALAICLLLELGLFILSSYV